MDEDEMDLIEIYVNEKIELFKQIPEQTGIDPLLIDIFNNMFNYMKELRKRVQR